MGVEVDERDRAEPPPDDPEQGQGDRVVAAYRQQPARVLHQR